MVNSQDVLGNFEDCMIESKLCFFFRIDVLILQTLLVQLKIMMHKYLTQIHREFQEQRKLECHKRETSVI